MIAALLLLAFIAFTFGAFVGALIAMLSVREALDEHHAIHEVVDAWRNRRYPSPAHRADQADITLTSIITILEGVDVS